LRLQAYGKAASSRSGGNIVGRLLKFNKGEYIAGQENEEISLNTKVVFNTDNVLIGWQRWEDNKPVEWEMGLVNKGFQPKTRSELGYTDESEWETFEDGKVKDPWTYGNQAVCKTLGRKPELFTLTVGSKGGRQAMGDLLVAYTEAALEEGHKEDYPIIALGRDFYMHSNKAFGKVWVPVFKIVGWQPRKEWELPEQVEKPAPARRSKQKQLSY